MDALCRVPAFAAAHRDGVASVEINLFLVRAKGAVALDALLALEKAAAQA